MRRGRKRSGIQKKYLRNIVLLLSLALVLTCVGVITYVRASLEEVITDKYNFMCEKTGLALEELFEQVDEATAECILHDEVQKSLGTTTTSPISKMERAALSKYFAYIGVDNVAAYCYVDNKGHLYTRSYAKITYHAFRMSGIADFLGDDYAKTKWFWTEDVLFGTNEPALFVGRYVRNMDYARKPGMLFLKMQDAFLEDLFRDEREFLQDVAVGIVDGSGNTCMSSWPENVVLTDEVEQTINSLVKEQQSGMIASGLRMKTGVLSAYRQAGSGLLVYVFVPNQVLYARTMRILTVLIGIYLFVLTAAIILSVLFSRRLSRPIQKISNAMAGFRGNDYSRMEELHTKTELDQISHSYNEMLQNIEELVDEVKEQEHELRSVEMNMLISQINPHFLYNTLDTIYMLARINKEETTMRMIQALSKYLRLCLSKGKEIVTVEDELENVKSYLEIQQIRDSDLFRHEIVCEVDAANEQVLKLILQPLVENAVKYGFRDIYEGGQIIIRVWKENGYLVFVVRNNGTVIEEQICEKINGLTKMPLSEMKNSFEGQENGYGIVNIITRLRLMYRDDIVFRAAREDGWTSFTVWVPARDYEEDCENDGDE